MNTLPNSLSFLLIDVVPHYIIKHNIAHFDINFKRLFLHFAQYYTRYFVYYLPQIFADILLSQPIYPGTIVNHDTVICLGKYIG